MSVISKIHNIYELPALHATAGGKVSMAYLSPKTRAKILESLELTPLSPSTITAKRGKYPD